VAFVWRKREKERDARSSAGFAFGATQNRVAKFFPTKKSHPADAYHLFSILFLVIFQDGKSVRGEPGAAQHKSLKVPDVNAQETNSQPPANSVKDDNERERESNCLDGLFFNLILLNVTEKMFFHPHMQKGDKSGVFSEGRLTRRAQNFSKHLLPHLNI